MTAAISCRGASRIFRRGALPPVIAVDNVDLEVQPGAFVAIQGPSGSGKTTLLGLIAGIERVDDGQINVLGHDIGRLNAAERARLRRLRVGLVFQSFGLVASLTAGENVALPLALEGVPPTDREERARAALASVGLEGMYDARVDELSGGQRQRIGVARAIVAQPQLVLADEPTGSLDDETAASILDLLRSKTSELGASLLLVTHDPQSAARADSRYHMRDGKLVPEATT